MGWLKGTARMEATSNRLLVTNTYTYTYTPTRLIFDPSLLLQSFTHAAKWDEIP